MSDTTGAWGIGLATLAGDRMLDAWFPEPHLGAPAAEPDTAELEAATGADELRGTRSTAIATVIDDLARPPRDTADAYLRLHLLSHRLIRPHGANLDGIFGVLPNVAWTSAGPVDVPELPNAQLRARAAGRTLNVSHGIASVHRKRAHHLLRRRIESRSRVLYNGLALDEIGSGRAAD